MENLNISPVLFGQMIESPNYPTLGLGQTDRLFILGHTDALHLNDPYQVVDLQTAVAVFQSDPGSPLLRSLYEAYYSGAKDIWLVACAPMSEYNDDYTQRDNAYYTTYHDRLDTTYSLLEQWDAPQIICPIEAPYYDAKGVDFLTQLANHCSSAYATTGSIRLGFLGTRTGPLTDPIINAMIFDPRILNDYLGDAGKFVAVFVGEGLFNFKELPRAYSGATNVAVGGIYSSMPPEKSLVYTKIPSIVSYVGRLRQDQPATIANAKLNPLWLTSMGQRAKTFETVVMTDNTLGVNGSDFWALAQMRLVAFVINEVRRLGNRYIGSIGYVQFKSDVQSMFSNLVRQSRLRSYTVNVTRSNTDRNTILVDIVIGPNFGIRQIAFSVQVGPQ